MKAGYSVTEVISRSSARSVKQARELAKKVGAMAAVAGRAHLKADLAWLCVPDSEISAVAHELAARKGWQGRIALHSSGALTSDQLNALRKCGAAVASAHPLMTFVRGSIPMLNGTPFALEGDASAVSVVRRIIRDLGGEAFIVNPVAKPVYHAWAAFLSPLLVAVLVTAEQVAVAAGLSKQQARRKMMPIVQQMLANYVALGPVGAFSGPLVRGDAEVVRMHIDALRTLPEAKEVYIALARAALRHLPVKNRNRMGKILAVHHDPNLS